MARNAADYCWRYHSLIVIGFNGSGYVLSTCLGCLSVCTFHWHGMVVSALVCCYKCTWIFRRSLHILPHIALRVCASVVTPARPFKP